MIAFDLDGTLAESKSPIEQSMAMLLENLLAKADVCVISGGTFDQIKSQVIDKLMIDEERMCKLHIMPVSGGQYYRYSSLVGKWARGYNYSFSSKQKKKIIEALESTAKEFGFWENETYGDIIEDRSSQITFSALGQKAPTELKADWDRDGSKKNLMRIEVSRKLPEFEVRAGGTTSIDVTMKGIDKSFGISNLARVNRLWLSEILFVGDSLLPGGNDYPVKAMGVDVIEVRNPKDTELTIRCIF